jgi:hypothetical protein
MAGSEISRRDDDSPGKNVESATVTCIQKPSKRPRVYARESPTKEGSTSRQFIPTSHAATDPFDPENGLVRSPVIFVRAVPDFTRLTVDLARIRFDYCCS